MSDIKLTIESLDAFEAASRAMARRLDRGERAVHSAGFAFESVEAMLKVLTPNRWTLMRSLRAAGPSSIRALAQQLGRDYRGVHADASALLAAGLIERGEDGRIFMPWTRLSAEFDLESAA